jgi:transglutaminase-like putative cysteine protease
MPKSCCLAMIALCASLAQAQGPSTEETFQKGAEAQVVVSKWRMGLIVKAQGGAFTRIAGTVTVPMDWRLEQQVRVIQQDLSPGVSITFKSTEGVARQMVVNIPSLPADEEARAVVTFEIKRHLLTPPESTDDFLMPKAKRSDRKLAAFLTPSPYIESNNPQIVEAARQIGTDEQKAWEKIEAIYDWVREKVQFQDNQGQGIKTTLATLRDGTGDCDEMSSLFVALCRANGVPARLVRVPGHCYAEFCLLDQGGKDRWFPCQASGTRAFGGMPDPRPILQKGDNVAATGPGSKKGTKVRFLPETLIGYPAGAGGSLKRSLVCEPLKD